MTREEIRDEDWYTPPQVGELIGFGPEAVRNLIVEGRIAAIRAKRQYRIRGREVRRFIAEQTTTGRE